MSKHIRLARCKHCGGKTEFIMTGVKHYAVCMICGIRTPSKKSREEAAAVWNRRDGDGNIDVLKEHAQNLGAIARARGEQCFPTRDMALWDLTQSMTMDECGQMNTAWREGYAAAEQAEG